jgi:hypothetical protein
MPQYMTHIVAGVTKDEHYRQNMVEDLHAETTQLLERYFGNTWNLDSINLKTVAFHLKTI